MTITLISVSDLAARLAAGQMDKLPFMRVVPGAGALENFAYRINTIAFVMWTFTVIAGAIWA